MPNCIQCLLFVEPESKLNSNKDVESANENSGTSTPSVVPKAYALLPSGHDTHPFCEILAQNGIEQIVNSSVAPSKDARLEVVEIHASIISESEQKLDFWDEPQKSFCIYCSSFNAKFVQRLFSKSSDVGLKESVHLAASDAESATGEVCLKLIKDWLALRVDITFRRPEGGTLLHFAAENGHINLLKLLLENGAMVDAKMNDGSTPLHKATGAGLIEIVRTLVEAGAEVNAKREDGTTPLHIAASLSVKHIPLVEFLILECGADVHATNTQSATPILYSVKSSPKVMQLLVENGADINVQSNKGTVLYIAIFGGWPETINYILSLKPRTDIKGNCEAFYLALLRDDEKYVKPVKEMVSQGFDISVGPEDARISSMLFAAIQKHLTDIVRSLVNLGADVNQCRSFGSSNLTPFFLAMRCKNKDIVQLLLNHGADVNAKQGPNNDRKSPLSYAVEYSTPEIVKILIAANPNNRNDLKLFERALLKASPRMVTVLVEDGFDPDFVSLNGETLMSVAVRFANLKAIKLLVRFGVRCKLTSLVNSKLKDTTVLQTFLDFCFQGMSRADETAARELFSTRQFCAKNLDCVRILAHHLIKMMVADERVATEELVPLQLFTVYGLAAFKDNCKAEVQRMKQDKVGSRVQVTFYDILIKSSHQIACYTRVRSVAGALKLPKLKSNYPIYASVLYGKFFVGQVRRMFFEEGMKAFKSLSKSARLPKLPDDVIMIIVSFLNNKQLFVLGKCYPSK